MSGECNLQRHFVCRTVSHPPSHVTTAHGPRPRRIRLRWPEYCKACKQAARAEVARFHNIAMGMKELRVTAISPRKVRAARTRPHLRVATCKLDAVIADTQRGVTQWESRSHGRKHTKCHSIRSIYHREGGEGEPTALEAAIVYPDCNLYCRVWVNPYAIPPDGAYLISERGVITCAS